MPLPDLARRQARVGVEWVADDAALDRMVEALAAAETVAMDTETNGLHAYRSRICLVQFYDGERVFLLDVLRLGLPEGVAERIADPALPKVLHGASHDVASLKEDFGAPLRGLFDTYVAASFLGLPKVSLADLLADLFHVPHDKTWQKKDWAQRPLPEEARAYLARDVLYLPALAEHLRNLAREKDILEEIEIECRRIEDTSATGQSFDPLGYLSIKGADELEPEALGVLREVYLERDRWARELDRPPFKVLPDGILLAMAKAGIRKPNGLKRYRPFSDDRPRAWNGEPARAREAFFEAIARGREHGGIPPEDEKALAAREAAIEAERRERRVPGKRARVEALKSFRKQESKKRGVPSVVVLPNWAIFELAADPPANMEELSAFGLGAKRIARYGNKILEILSRRSTREKSEPAK